MAPSARPRARHAGSGQTYAPRPEALPRRSTESVPSGDRTILTSSRFARTVRHATHVLCGGVCVALPIFLLLLSAEKRTVLFLELVLVGHRRLHLDLGDEVVADRGLFLLGTRRDGFHRLGLDHDLRLGLRLHLGADLGLAADVDPPARDLRREARVLAFLADREREVAVRHDDVRGLLLRDDVHPDHRRRRERVRDELLGRVVVLDDLDTLATELVRDRLHAQPALADACADRVEPGLARTDRDLGTRARLARDAHDLDLPVIDLGHLELE